MGFLTWKLKKEYRLHPTLTYILIAVFLLSSVLIGIISHADDIKDYTVNSIDSQDEPTRTIGLTAICLLLGLMGLIAIDALILGVIFN